MWSWVRSMPHYVGDVSCTTISKLSRISDLFHHRRIMCSRNWTLSVIPVIGNSSNRQFVIVHNNKMQSHSLPTLWNKCSLLRQTSWNQSQVASVLHVRVWGKSMNFLLFFDFVVCCFQCKANLSWKIFNCNDLFFEDC